MVKGRMSDKKYIMDNLLDFLLGKYDEELFELSSKVREKKYKNNVYIRGVIDISNYCVCDCKFCGNACTSKVERFRLDTTEIIDSIKAAQESGIDLIHLAAGVDGKVNDEYLMPVIKYCNDNDIVIEMAIGEKNLEIYDRLIRNGVNRFIVKFETSNKQVFENIKVCHSTYKEYIDFIKKLKEKGVSMGSGNIIGMPGTTLNDLVGDIVLLNTLDLDMVSTSVFKANKESIFWDKKDGDSNLSLRFIALVNLLYYNKKISIPTNSSFGLENKIAAMKLGANVLSVNYTKSSYEKKYSIYEGGARIRANYEKTNNYIDEAGMKLVSWKEFNK